MYKQIKRLLFHFRNNSVIQILLILISSTLTTKAEVQKQIDSLNYGISEKGIYLGIDHIINSSKSLSFGFNYLNLRPGSYDAGFSENIPLDIYIKGVSISMNKYLYKKEKSNWNLFINSEIGFNNLKGFSKIDLSRLYYDLGNIKIKCSSCGVLKMETNTLTLTPKLSLGISRHIKNRFNIRALVGIQYITINHVHWNHESNYPLPNYVTKQINSSVNKINSTIDNLSNIQPAVSILFNYKL